MKAAGLVVLTIAAMAVALTGQSAEPVRVMSAGSLAASHARLVPAFERSSGLRVMTLATSTGVGADAIAARVKRGEAVDVVILARAALDDLTREGLIVDTTRTDLARSYIGVGVRAGAPKPDISSVDALKQTLVRARSVAISAQVSGIYLTGELFPQLGIADVMASKIQRIDRERVGAVVARGEAEIGFQQISELMEVPGVDIVGALPDDVQRVTTFSAGIAAKAGQAHAAQRFISFFTSADAARVMRETGLEPIAAAK